MIELYTAATPNGWAEVEIDEMPHLQRWIDRVAERPAVQKGVGIPGEIDPEAQRKWIEAFRAGEA